MIALVGNSTKISRLHMISIGNAFHWKIAIAFQLHHSMAGYALSHFVRNKVIDDNTRFGGPLQARMSVTLLQSTRSFIIFAAFQPFFPQHEHI